jgi:LSD1 subclass zinc finger protein
MMMLEYAAGALSVKCTACDFLTLTFLRNKESNRGGIQMVVVENPPTVNDAGQISNNMSVGLAEKL